MTWTWADIMSLALVRSGILGRGQVANASMQDVAIKTTGLLLDEWDGQGLSLPAISTDITFNTVVGQTKYLLGPGGTPANVVRPRSILTATLTIATNPVQRVPIQEVGFKSYTLIPIPSTQSQSFTYSIDPKWPQMEFYLYPDPDKVYPIILNCKLKWSDTLTTPDVNPFAIVQAAEGYANALTDNLALKLAENYRLETATLQSKAAGGRYTIASAVMDQYRKTQDSTGIGVFSDTVIRSGINV